MLLPTKQENNNLEKKKKPEFTRNIYLDEKIDTQLTQAVRYLKEIENEKPKNERIRISRSVIVRIVLADWLDKFEKEFLKEQLKKNDLKKA